MEPICDIALINASAYAARHELRLGKRLGFGIHGSVQVTWAEWETEKREQFGVRWTAVLAVISALEDLGIHLLDVSPSNIAFLD
jgi:hypothetical protein